MKKCIACHIEKPLDNFHKHPQMKDGHLNKCKVCVNLYVHQYRKDNLESIRKYDRERGRTEKRLFLNRERIKKKKKEYTAIGIRWRERNPDKRAAHVILGNAVRDRRIFKQPCEVCGNIKVDGHHDDYTKPLEVRWLCRKHHKELHRKYTDIPF